MKISFLVTYYNQGKFVFESMKHISELNIHCDYEVLVGDDGSTDNTISEVMKWKKLFKDKLKVFQMNRDDCVTDNILRVSRLRKKLLNESNGDFFCFLDGDDYYCDSEFVRDAINIFENNQSISIVMFKYKKLYQDGKEEEKGLPEKEGIIRANKYIEQYYIHAGACVLKRKNDIELVKRLEQSIYYDDNDIVLYNLNFGDIWYIERCIYVYRQSRNSLWNKLNRAQQGILNILGADAEAYLLPKYRKEIYFRYRRDIFYAFFRRNNPYESIGMEYYNKCLKISEILNGNISNCLMNYEDAAPFLRDEVLKIVMELKEKDSELYYYVMNQVT